MTHLTQAEFARQLGVNRSTITRWLQNGRIKATPEGLIDPAAASAMRDATESPMPHHQARKAQIDEARQGTSGGAGVETPQAASGEAEQPADLESLGHQLKRATVDLQRHKAELAAMEVDKLAGALVDRADIDFVLADFGGTLRALLEGLPDRLAGEIAAHQGDVNGIHKALEDAGREILESITGQMQRRMQELTR